MIHVVIFSSSEHETRLHIQNYQGRSYENSEEARYYQSRCEVEEGSCNIYEGRVYQEASCKENLNIKSPCENRASRLLSDTLIVNQLQADTYVSVLG